MFYSSSPVRLLNGLVLAVLLVCSVVGDVVSQEIVDSGDAESSTLPPPPPVDEAAQFARYIVRFSDWCSVSHISHQAGSSSFPISRVLSFSDGSMANSTGVPYIYTTLMDPGTRDLRADNRSSFTMSLAETPYCAARNLDPEDPRCPQVILTGQFQFVENGTAEWDWALDALFSKHPAMRTWPTYHHWVVGKLNIGFIQLVDNIGGSKYPSVEDYFKASPLRV